MLRRAAAVILALALNPALLHAQVTVFTVTVPSAEVHKGPSTVNPVIGHVSRGTTLRVSLNLGSWVKIPWPSAPDGVGYVHVTMGRLSSSSTADGAATTNTLPRPSSASAAAPGSEPVPPQVRMSAREPVVARDQLTGTPIRHIFGVGGLVGSMSSFGATARVWRHSRFGIQLGVTRDIVKSDIAAGRVTSVQFEPELAYALFDRVTDYVWIRPYVGSGVSFRHQTLKVSPAALESMSDNGVGFRVFGGSELTFASVPRFGVSVELGYRRYPAPFAGFDADRLSVSIAGHWYVK
jgi:hypothetical protein